MHQLTLTCISANHKETPRILEGKIHDAARRQAGARSAAPPTPGGRPCYLNKACTKSHFLYLSTQYCQPGIKPRQMCCKTNTPTYPALTTAAAQPPRAQRRPVCCHAAGVHLLCAVLTNMLAKAFSGENICLDCWQSTAPTRLNTRSIAAPGARVGQAIRPTKWAPLQREPDLPPEPRTHLAGLPGPARPGAPRLRWRAP